MGSRLSNMIKKQISVIKSDHLHEDEKDEAHLHDKMDELMKVAYAHPVETFIMQKQNYFKKMSQQQKL